MNNNDILRRIRYTFDFEDNKMTALFEKGGLKVTRADLSDWLKKDEDESFKEISDNKLAIFLNGLIIEKRGKKEGPQPVAETKLNNNIIFRKVKIALDFQSEDIIALFETIDKKISAHELSSFFRNPKHSRYRSCNDQYLRNFLSGVQKYYRG